MGQWEGRVRSGTPCLPRVRVVFSRRSPRGTVHQVLGSKGLALAAASPRQHWDQMLWGDSEKATVAPGNLTENLSGKPEGNQSLLEPGCAFLDSAWGLAPASHSTELGGDFCGRTTALPGIAVSLRGPRGRLQSHTVEVLVPSFHFLSPSPYIV